MSPFLHHKSPCTPHTLLSSCASTAPAMSQEGANLPQEVEGSHDQATAPHGSIPTGVGSPTATMMPASSIPSSVSNLASAGNNAGSSESASPAVLSAGEDNNAASLKITGSALLLASEGSKAEFKLASPAVLLASEEKGSDAGPKLASPATLHDCDNNKAGSDAGVDNDAARSKLASLAVLHAGGGNNGGSKIASPAAPHATVDNTTGERINAGFKVPNPAVLHSSKGMDNKVVVLALPANKAFPHGSRDNKARTKLAIQAVPQAVGNSGSSRRLTRSAAAALHAAKSNASKLAIQVAPRPHAGKDNYADGTSSKAARSAAIDAGESNAKKGKKNIAEEQRAPREADVGGGSGKGNAATAEDVDHNLHIFTERERRKKMKNMFSTLHALLPQLPEKADKATIVGEAVTFIQSLERTAERLEKLKLERQRAQQAAQQQLQLQLVVGGAGSSSGASSAARHPAPAPASREATLADMVHGWEAQVAQQAAVAAANKALVAAGPGAGGSSSSTTTQQQLPRGAVPFPAPAAGFQTWSGQNVVVSVGSNEAYINLRCPRQVGTLTKVLFVLERHHLDVVTTTVSTDDGLRMYGIHARANPASASAVFPENLCAEDRFKLAVSEIVQLINI